MRINFELLDIRAFLAIYDIRNFRLAAEAVGLSQPALSRRIQALEASLGAPLLERSRRGVSPTTIGRELEPLLRRVISDLESSILASGDMGPKQHGRITIASIPTAAIDFLPRVIQEFNQTLSQHPISHFRSIFERRPRGRRFRGSRVRNQHPGIDAPGHLAYAADD